jgi:6-phosphogluconolactonase
MIGAAERIAELLTAAAAARGVATMALAGGSTPRQAYRLLSAQPHDRAIPWERVRLFLGDERCVPADHPESNQRMVGESLLARLPHPPAFHPMVCSDRSGEAAAARYRDCLAREVPESVSGIPRFDLILLGMGDDAHTASLFPGTPILDETRPVAPVFVPEKNSWRMSLTLPVLNAARHVLFLVTGSNKAPALAAVFAGGPDRDRPASLVRPESGTVEWHVDAAAAARLPR